MNDAFGLDGRVGVVTGGAGPLGAVICRSLAAQGARVLAVDLPAAHEASAGDPLDGITPVAVDLTDRGAVSALVHQLDDLEEGLSFLVNNAALTGDATLTGYTAAFDLQTDEAFDAALELNLSVPFRLSRRLAPALRRSRNGVILNISSIYGLVGPDLRIYAGTSMGNPAGYAASKGGLIQLTRYLATVLAPEVRVNCLALGGIWRGQDDGFVKAYVDRTPLGRMATEQDAVGAVQWLVSEASSYVTGQIVALDGGWTSW